LWIKIIMLSSSFSKNHLENTGYSKKMRIKIN